VGIKLREFLEELKRKEESACALVTAPPENNLSNLQVFLIMKNFLLNIRRQMICNIGFGFLAAIFSASAGAEEATWSVGLSSNRTLIEAEGFKNSDKSARTIIIIAGMQGPSPSSAILSELYKSYLDLDARESQPNLIIIPHANPQNEILVFPPQGDAYRENSVAHSLWRWLGIQAPDLVVLLDDDSNLNSALQNNPVAGIGEIPAITFSAQSLSLDWLGQQGSLPVSAAKREITRRRARTPAALVTQLAQYYGHDFSNPAYVPGMALIGRMRMGEVAAVDQLVNSYIDGGPIDIRSSSLLAGQLVFAELAERTNNEDYLQLALRAAELGFDDIGSLKEVMPTHAEMSDAVFMATPLLAKVGKLTGEKRFTELALVHVQFMQNLLLREDGLYRHTPLANVAWGRGNGFPALGLALSLSDISESNQEFSVLLQSFINHLEALLPYQDSEGMWHEVIDYPGSFAEITSTAMIGTAIKRGLDKGWLEPGRFQPALDRSWQAVLGRTDFTDGFMNACQSTGKLKSLDAYLDRLAILGHDDRAGGMVLLFANEMAGNF
jgi:unsaturated rhamnogalacturonyl hydrolase